jgi:hypothetical protein
MKKHQFIYSNLDKLTTLQENRDANLAFDDPSHSHNYGSLDTKWRG